MLTLLSCGSTNNSAKDKNTPSESEQGSQDSARTQQDTIPDLSNPEGGIGSITPDVELWPGEAELTKLDICDGKPCNERIEGIILASIQMNLETFYIYNSTLGEKEGEYVFEVIGDKKFFTFKSYKDEDYTITSGEWEARSGYLALKNKESTDAYYFSLTQFGDVSGFTGKVKVVFSDGSINERTIRLR